MFNIGAGEWLLLAVLGIILVGPDRLPHVATEAAHLIRRFKEFTTKATEELRENLGPGFENLQPADLHPKTFVKKQLGDLMDETPVAKPVRPSAKIDPDLI
jgi:sec-independent protein translocase protein TatB